MNESPQRSHFNHFHPILTRPQDNDVNGHIAGATVHGYFETAIQAFLFEQAELALRDGELAGVVISSAAQAGSTVEYRLALFRPGEPQACAAGTVVQVFVERASGSPVTFPDALQGSLMGLQLND